MTDPWLFGTAFKNGWDLISKTQFSLEDFRDITHIWFSHEHPDHFAPPVLKQIDPAVRARITVLFQETKDKKVVTFCRGLGFNVRELRNHHWHVLTPGFRVLCGKVPFYDSWLLVEAGGLKILNTNDCVVDGEAIAADIARHTGRVDVLLTQFSYANWIGNAEDIELRRESAREKLERVKVQVRTFAPTHTVPFASFVYFSHEENAYMNDAINTVDGAVAFIQRETRTTPVVLYPGDDWDIGCDHEAANAAALEAYRRDYELTSKPFRRSSTVSLDELCALSREYVARITRKNSRLLMRLLGLPPLHHFASVTMRVTDLARVLAFDFEHGLRPIDDGAADVDVSLPSESLAFVLKFDFGFDTLLVNARFQATQQHYKRLVNMFYLGPLNNTGRSLHPRTLLDLDFVTRALRKLLSRSRDRLGQDASPSGRKPRRISFLALHRGTHSVSGR